ncbi:MAG: hypothetical protein H0U73_13015 [Tatlockia sp.]|nr:hypothetical protein [Tatlockia sp.]
MKLRSLLFVSCLSLLSSAYAESRQVFLDAPSPEAKSAKQSVTKGMIYDCAIRLINYSNYDLRMWGEVTNGAVLQPAYIYDRAVTHLIDIYDYNYYMCPEGMYLNVETVRGTPVFYNRFITPGSLISVYTRNGVAKVEIKAK